jgi:hypothetical protein
MKSATNTDATKLFEGQEVAYEERMDTQSPSKRRWTHDPRVGRRS